MEMSFKCSTVMLGHLDYFHMITEGETKVAGNSSSTLIMMLQERWLYHTYDEAETESRNHSSDQSESSFAAVICNSFGRHQQIRVSWFAEQF